MKIHDNGLACMMYECCSPAVLFLLVRLTGSNYFCVLGWVGGLFFPSFFPSTKHGLSVSEVPGLVRAFFRSVVAGSMFTVVQYFVLLRYFN